MRVRVYWLFLLWALPSAAHALPRECHPEGETLICGYHCLRSDSGHWDCANTPDGRCRIGGDGRVVCTHDPAAGVPAGGLPIPRQSECLKGRDGHVACGYQCFENIEGQIICAQTPEGTCIIDTGRVLCSEVDESPWVVKTTTRATCVKDTSGRVVCGYQCEEGLDGLAACAQTPDGACSADDFGHIVCTPFNPESRLVELPSYPPSTCERDAKGQRVCGYQCLRGTDGSVACATTPDGACALNASGQVRCTEFPPSTRFAVPAASSAGESAPGHAAGRATSSDAGKPCSDDSQCEGFCLALAGNTGGAAPGACSLKLHDVCHDKHVIRGKVAAGGPCF